MMMFCTSDEEDEDERVEEDKDMDWPSKEGVGDGSSIEGNRGLF